MLNINIDVVKSQLHYTAIGKSFNEGTNIRIQILNRFPKPIRVFHIEVKSKLKWFPFYIRREQSIKKDDIIPTTKVKEYFVPFSNSELRDYQVIINRDKNNIYKFSLE